MQGRKGQTLSHQGMEDGKERKWASPVTHEKHTGYKNGCICLKLPKQFSYTGSPANTED